MHQSLLRACRPNGPDNSCLCRPAQSKAPILALYVPPTQITAATLDCLCGRPPNAPRHPRMVLYRATAQPSLCRAYGQQDLQQACTGSAIEARGHANKFTGLLVLTAKHTCHPAPWHPAPLRYGAPVAPRKPLRTHARSTYRTVPAHVVHCTLHTKTQRNKRRGCCYDVRNEGRY